ncbi:MAG: hypothetical protein WCA31_01940 [Acidimicrobiales bacterium]
MSYGLAPRPSLPPEEMAALIAAAEELLRAERRRVKSQTTAWRFSGRWFAAGRFAMRRPHQLS